ncbi:F-box only protein 2 isoform X1 [Perognathus longimembris pacificus]|uniref:F-box only protein 2 isoform X1 n=1 Tax=Perognathus longimembris pacificus TaxID=214514 RepID=UPI002018D619|nr:F-box only protein 2 isoform X1 [Perognathus longimembris pacificus]
MDGDGDPESVGQPEEASLEEQPEEEAAACAEGSAEEEQPGEEEGEAAAYLAELPEPLLLRVLAELPAAQLVQACRLVCLRWKELVDGAPLWLLKCQQEGLVPEGDAEDGDHWQHFYFLSKRRRNLLRNPCGEEDLEGWSDVENGGDGWRVEEMPGDSGVEFIHDDSVKKYFASSFEWCRKAQVIDLQAEGYWEELLDTTQPAIVVKDWYSGRTDAGCLYELTVRLLSEHEDVLAEFSSGQVAVPQDSEDGGWMEISHTFTDYGPGVRFVRFEHGGQDSVYWKGWFGARVTNSSVWVEP